MKNKIIIITALLIFICTAITAAAAETPVDINFTKHGGGQFIYCNNPEFISEADLSTDENPNPVYMLKQEGLKPGKYSVFFCFYNWTSFDVEPDIEFISDSNAQITINSVGYYIPKGWDYWDCLGTWSDYMGVNIRTLDSLAQYVPYQDIDLPKTFNLKNSNEWINKYIYNYDSVSPKVTFNMVVDFTIESGTADVNFAALKSYDVLGDRSHHSPNAAQSPYKNDTSIKGIEKESLPIVECNLDVDITSKTGNGQNIPIRVYNQYFPSGNTYDFWMTNINPSRDAYQYSKECAAGSDMLEFELKDNSKLKYYGNRVASANKNNIWNFDIYHHNTTAYTSDGPSILEGSHIPNDKLPDKLDINNPPNLDYEFNLGNFGVTNRYHLKVKNSDYVQRSLNYFIDASFSSCIVSVRDADGTLLNPYTLSEDDAFALSKGINWTKKKDYMFSVMLKPNETRMFVIDVTLPTNCYGGIVNGLTADNKLLAEPKEIIGFPVKTEKYEYENRMWFDGYRSMRWLDGELYNYSNGWKKITLPEKTKKVFESRTKDIIVTKTSTGYIARFSGYDQYGGNIADQSTETGLYILDDKFEYQKTITFPGYISESIYADGITYIKSDKIYETSNGITFTESNASVMPLSNGKSVIEKRLDGYYIRYNGEKDFQKINFEYTDFGDIQAADGVYYVIRSLKNYDTDPNTGNVIAVSTDGINYRDMALPNTQFRFMRIDSVGDEIFAVGRNEFTTRDKFDYKKGLIVKTPSGYMSGNYTFEKLDDSVFYDVNYIARVFGFDVNTQSKNGETAVTIQKDDKSVTAISGTYALYNGDESRFIGTAPYMQGSAMYVPFKDFMEVMGYKVEYDEKNLTVTVE